MKTKEQYYVEFKARVDIWHMRSITVMLSSILSLCIALGLSTYASMRHGFNTRSAVFALGRWMHQKLPPRLLPDQPSDSFVSLALIATLTFLFLTITGVVFITTGRLKCVTESKKEVLKRFQHFSSYFKCGQNCPGLLSDTRIEIFTISGLGLGMYMEVIGAVLLDSRLPYDGLLILPGGLIAIVGALLLMALGMDEKQRRKELSEQECLELFKFLYPELRNILRDVDLRP